jgi:hypothetical protein
LKRLHKSTTGNVYVNVTLPNGERFILVLLNKSTTGNVYVNVTLQNVQRLILETIA